MSTSELAVRAAARLNSLSRVDAYLAGKMETIPEAGDDVMERMLEMIVTIDRIEYIDAPWNSNGLGEYADFVLTLRGLKKVPSDYANTCGWFLAVDAVLKHDGSGITATTSSRLVMGQLITIHEKAWFPCDMIPRYSDRPTKDGYYPMHLDLHRGESLKPMPKGPVVERMKAFNEQLRAKRAAEREAMARDQAAADVVDAEVVDDGREATASEQAAARRDTAAADVDEPGF